MEPKRIRDWLNIVKTNQAKTKIRAWFKKERRPENIATGKAEIEREFQRNIMWEEIVECAFI